MSLDEASDWGARIARRELATDDATQLDDGEWQRMLIRLSESAASGTHDLEAFRAAFDRASTRELGTREPPSFTPATAETVTAERPESEPPVPQPSTPRPAIATPSYLLATPKVASDSASTAPLISSTAPATVAMEVDETVPVGFILPKDTLPFVPPTPRAPPSAPPAAALEVPGSRDVSAHADATMAPTLDAQRVLLPFIQGIRAEAATAQKATVELRVTPAADVDETLPPFVNRAPALPFALTSADAPSVDETAFVSRGQVFGPATPFVKSPATITLEEYAAFLGELSRDPNQAAQVRARHGIKDEETQRAVGARFAAEFARDPAKRATFDTILAKARQRRPG